MAVLFRGEIWVDYRFAYLQPDDDDPPDDFGLDGQRNGLCGAAIPGVLSLTFGLHTGYVPITVEALETRPELDTEWEEIVEVSFAATRTDYVLAPFEDFYPLILPFAGQYRVRFNASGMDRANDADYRKKGRRVLDRYLLQLWPDAEAQPDAILRQTSESAAYWHRVAQGLEK